MKFNKTDEGIQLQILTPSDVLTFTRESGEIVTIKDAKLSVCLLSSIYMDII